ncbi:hypothetical protein EBB07_04050 [Paenibacillaceae bacterium]|nr:hypothetical protein EBB07_04050 [Paenibacillaceae bacterium]
MLRMMFGEPPRKASGRLMDTIMAMERFVTLLQKRIEKSSGNEDVLKKYEIWTLGLLGSVDELEQSQYVADHFAAGLTTCYLNRMSEEELMNYYRYIYFDKNAFIRVFSLLDKLGTLMNEMFELKTEKVKPYFSYFTVLRNMRENNLQPELSKSLNAIKDRYSIEMARLRKRRNTEIHYMNSEMQDDLQRIRSDYGGEVLLENIKEQKLDLEACCILVMESLHLTFDYGCRKMKGKG